MNFLSTTRYMLLVIFMTIGLRGELSAKMWCVNLDGSNGCDTLINAAIGKATAGDTVFVWDGIYQENVNIIKRVVLLGANPITTIVSPRTGDAIRTGQGCDGVIIQGFTASAPTGWGIVLDGGGTEYVRNCISRYNGLDGLWVGAAGGNGNYFVSNCIIHGNSQRGIQHNDCNFYLYNSVVFGNAVCGVNGAGSAYDNSKPYDHDCFFDNANNNFAGYSSAGAGTIQTPAQIIDPASGNYHLSTGSPCLNTGREGGAYEDCDGTRNDMGVYGGPDAVCGPGPMVTELQIIPATVVKGQSFKVQAKAKTR